MNNAVSLVQKQLVANLADWRITKVIYKKIKISHDYKLFCLTCALQQYRISFVYLIPEYWCERIFSSSHKTSVQYSVLSMIEIKRLINNYHFEITHGLDYVDKNPQ